MSFDFSSVEFAENPEPRCPVVLLIDCSGSMGNSIDQVNQGLIDFSVEVKNDSLASQRVEVAVITFGGEVLLYELKNGNNIVKPNNFDPDLCFVSAADFIPPTLKASGLTPMGEAVKLGLDILNQRKITYRNNGIDYFRPWMFLMTDGEPTDSRPEFELQRVANDVKNEENRKGLAFYGVGTDGANMSKLSSFSDQRSPIKLQGLQFKEMFVWLSRSLTAISNSKTGEMVSLPSPDGWASIDTSSN